MTNLYPGQYKDIAEDDENASLGIKFEPAKHCFYLVVDDGLEAAIISLTPEKLDEVIESLRDFKENYNKYYGRT